MELGIKGRVAVITGSDKGIGKAIAKGLAAEGVNVVLPARGKEQLDKAADEIQNQYKVRVLAIPTDIMSTPSLKSVAEATAKEFGTIHIIVNNAGSPIRRMDRQVNWPEIRIGWRTSIWAENYGKTAGQDQGRISCGILQLDGHPFGTLGVYGRSRRCGGVPWSDRAKHFAGASIPVDGGISLNAR